MKISYCSLGCKVNQYETESIINTFLDHGFTLGDFHEVCDVYLINTCSITHTGDAKSRKMIHQAIKTNPNAVVAVMGCYAQLQIEDIRKIEGVDVLIGTTHRDQMYSYVMEALKTKSKVDHYDDVLQSTCYEELKVAKFTDRIRGFVKIQDGCDNYCSYCTIPYARGHIRSRNPQNVIQEIAFQTSLGVNEIVLTGINTGTYGKDLKDYSFSKLLLDLVKNVQNLGRIRISSIEATEISDELLTILKENSNHFCLHLHIPLQGGCDATLKRMQRKYSLEEYKKKINKIRLILPNINITSDIMVGFAGETEDDFNTSLKEIEAIGFGEIHVFPYSRRPKTPAYSYPNQVSEVEKHNRVQKMLSLNQKMAIQYRKKFLNEIVDVLVEKYDEKTNIAKGHSSNYLEVSFPTHQKDIVNTFVKVKITSIGYPICQGEEQYEI